MTTRAVLDNQLRAAAFDCCDPDFVSLALTLAGWERLLETLSEDVAALAGKDPAAHNDPLYVLQSYTSFKAVLHHRLAHTILTMRFSDEKHEAQKAGYAGIVASRGKILSGAEIHPGAKIGRRFVLDHGWGTVIGETCEIGDDCYVLGGVTLGACGISANPDGQRHPIIGNRVQIGAFARVFGRIRIGDDVFIGPHCVVKDDVPSNTVITIRTELQVVRQRNSHPELEQHPLSLAVLKRSMGASPESNLAQKPSC
jgi:serine O-acetyltransferase